MGTGEFCWLGCSLGVLLTVPWLFASRMLKVFVRCLEVYEGSMSSYMLLVMVAAFLLLHP